MRKYLAVDIGASSGRHMLGWVENGVMKLLEVYRFKNGYSKKDGHDCWDIDNLYKEILQGLKVCKEMGHQPVSMGIDTWGVDFVLIDSDGNRITDAVAYRDKRTAGMDKKLEESLSFERLYEITGIQKQIYNSIYQLLWMSENEKDKLEKADRLLFIPDYLNYLLTGKAVNEYTISTTSAMISAGDKTWNEKILELLGIKKPLFGEPVMPGNSLGGFKEETIKETGFDCEVVLPASHDTGSAFLAVPAKDENSVFISSGTWSLLGIEQMQPNITEKGMLANFTNEGGYNGRYRYLKNIMGLWMIQSIRRNYGEKYSFAQLESMARECSGFDSLVDVNSQRFLAPDNMLEEVQRACKESGQKVPQTPGEVVQCVYKSLAKYYKTAIDELEEITGRKFTTINIVGGGSKDGYLNELTAKETGLPVYAGPTEGTALGNLMVQMIKDGAYKDLQAARDAIDKSFTIVKYSPE